MQKVTNIKTGEPFYRRLTQAEAARLLGDSAAFVKLEHIIYSTFEIDLE